MCSQILPFPGALALPSPGQTQPSALPQLTCPQALGPRAWVTDMGLTQP